MKLLNFKRFPNNCSALLILRNIRLGSEYAGLEFWLSSISCHAPGAPIFIVGTHIDQVIRNIFMF